MESNDTLHPLLLWLQQTSGQFGGWFSRMFGAVDWSFLTDNAAALWIQGVFASWRAQSDVAISSSIAALAVVLALASITQTRSVRKRLESVKGDFFAAFRPKFIIRDVYAPHYNSGESV